MAARLFVGAVLLALVTLCDTRGTFDTSNVVSYRNFTYESGTLSYSGAWIRWENGDKIHIDRNTERFRRNSLVGRTGQNLVSFRSIDYGFVANATTLVMFEKTSRAYVIPILAHGLQTASVFDVCTLKIYYTARLLQRFAYSVSALRDALLNAVEAAAYMFEQSFERLSIVSFEESIHASAVSPANGATIEWTIEAFGTEQINAHDQDSVCAKLLFDLPEYYPYVGVAFVGSGCDQGYYFGIVCYTTPAETAVITAHEVGHIMDANHDQLKYIMYPDISDSALTFLFSATSKTEMGGWEADASCLSEVNRTNTKEPIPYEQDGWWRDEYAVIIACVVMSVGLIVAIEL